MLRNNLLRGHRHLVAVTRPAIVVTARIARAGLAGGAHCVWAAFSLDLGRIVTWASSAHSAWRPRAPGTAGVSSAGAAGGRLTIDLSPAEPSPRAPGRVVGGGGRARGAKAVPPPANRSGRLSRQRPSSRLRRAEWALPEERAPWVDRDAAEVASADGSFGGAAWAG